MRSERDSSEELTMQRNLCYLYLGRKLGSCLVCSNLCMQGGLIFRSAFGRMISPKQIMLCLRHPFRESSSDVNTALCGLPQAKPSVCVVIPAEQQALFHLVSLCC